MTRAERTKIVIKAQKIGKVTDELYSAFSPMLKKQFAGKVPFDDLLGIITCGMHTALTKWDQDKGEYLTMCYYGIGAEIHEYYRKEFYPISYPLTNTLDVSRFTFSKYEDLCDVDVNASEDVIDKVESVYNVINAMDEAHQAVFDSYFEHQVSISVIMKELGLSRKKVNLYLKDILVAVDSIYS